MLPCVVGRRRVPRFHHHDGGDDDDDDDFDNSFPPHRSVCSCEGKQFPMLWPLAARPLAATVQSRPG